MGRRGLSKGNQERLANEVGTPNMQGSRCQVKKPPKQEDGQMLSVLDVELFLIIN